MSIYRLYLQNSSRAGFWIQHRSWPNMCAQVMTIAEHGSGALPGASPIYEHAPVSMRFFDVRSGRPVSGATSTFPPEDHGYILIAEPAWSR